MTHANLLDHPDLHRGVCDSGDAKEYHMVCTADIGEAGSCSLDRAVGVGDLKESGAAYTSVRTQRM